MGGLDLSELQTCPDWVRQPSEFRIHTAATQHWGDVFMLSS